MQNDDTTIANFGEQADDLMTEMAAAGMHGMSKAQADLVVRMGVMLDFAALLECGSSTIKYWKNNGRIADWAKVKVEALYRGMQVREAA